MWAGAIGGLATDELSVGQMAIRLLADGDYSPGA
jgi:hypothetical protein